MKMSQIITLQQNTAHAWVSHDENCTVIAG